MTIVNGFHLLTIAIGARVISRCGMDPRSTYEFSEICNGELLFVKKCKVSFNILTVISYDLVVLRLTSGK